MAGKINRVFYMYESGGAAEHKIRGRVCPPLFTRFRFVDFIYSGSQP